MFLFSIFCFANVFIMAGSKSHFSNLVDRFKSIGNLFKKNCRLFSTLLLLAFLLWSLKLQHDIRTDVLLSKIEVSKINYTNSTSVWSDQQLSAIFKGICNFKASRAY